MRGASCRSGGESTGRGDRVVEVVEGFGEWRLWAVVGLGESLGSGVVGGLE